MKEIKPVHMGDSGPKVANLQNGLLFLLFHEPGISDNNRESLRRLLGPELRTRTYGRATAELVGIYQYQLKNWPDYLPRAPQWLKEIVRDMPISTNTGRGNGDVDGGTARALNWLLKKFGAL
ncbi:hypothetical protein QA640_17810 [Bradyrhizobium sp. CB82]|uniref:hypothetical protein n=1 Tax=Bradyrhizobium sp. CB82 TaxID=3039159 RepID=UPI0024B23C2A|nr:hypothetical protein [Bradyrhizobium sp. CB82]WFU44139.1 hypothetical protein QA640_17810 [Bradyrhizobium sp. CB82]